MKATATSCRSTPATSSSASCASSGGASTAGGRSTTRSTRSSAGSGAGRGRYARRRRSLRRTEVPDLAFEVTGAAAERYAAVPTLSLQLRIEEKTGVRVQAIALRVQIRTEPQLRRYSPEEEERLYEVFGEARQW